MTVPPGEPSQTIPGPDRSEVLPRAWGLWRPAHLVIGSVVGSGIFVKPGIIAHHVGDFRVILSLWVAGGVLALFGGLCFAELGAMLPRAGGLYVYLREAYGPLVAFLLGWCELLLYRPGSTGSCRSSSSARWPACVAGRPRTSKRWAWRSASSWRWRW